MQQRLFYNKINFDSVIEMLRHSSPSVFKDYANRKTITLNNRLDTLRMRYKNTEDEMMRSKILKEVSIIKKELELLKI